MNIYDEVTKLPRQHRLALCQFILRTLNPSYDEKVRLLGRVPKVIELPEDHSARLRQFIERLEEQRRPAIKPWIARDARRHTRISRDTIA